MLHHSFIPDPLRSDLWRERRSLTSRWSEVSKVTATQLKVRTVCHIQVSRFLATLPVRRCSSFPHNSGLVRWQHYQNTKKKKIKTHRFTVINNWDWEISELVMCLREWSMIICLTIRGGLTNNTVSGKYLKIQVIMLICCSCLVSAVGGWAFD